MKIFDSQWVVLLPECVILVKSLYEMYRLIPHHEITVLFVSHKKLTLDLVKEAVVFVQSVVFLFIGNRFQVIDFFQKLGFLGAVPDTVRTLDFKNSHAAAFTFHYSIRTRSQDWKLWIDE